MFGRRGFLGAIAALIGFKAAPASAESEAPYSDFLERELIARYGVPFPVSIEMDSNGRFYEACVAFTRLGTPVHLDIRIVQAMNSIREQRLLMAAEVAAFEEGEFYNLTGKLPDAA